MAGKVKLYPIDKDYLRLIRKVNNQGQLFVPRNLGIASNKSLDRLTKAGKIEYVNRKLIGGYRIVGGEAT